MWEILVQIPPLPNEEMGFEQEFPTFQVPALTTGLWDILM